MEMVEFSPGKFSMEILQKEQNENENGALVDLLAQSREEASDASIEATMAVSNTWRKPMNLYISYMTTGPTEQIYPNVHVWTTTTNDNNNGGSGGRTTSSQEIQPLWNKSSSSPSFHVVAHTRIGKIEKGTSILHIQSK